MARELQQAELRARQLRLSAMPHLRDLDEPTLRLLAQEAKEHAFAPQDSLFEPESSKRSIFLVHEGSVQVTSSARTKTCRAPCILGLADLLCGYPTPMAATCRSRVKAFELNAKLLLDAYQVGFSALLITSKALAQDVLAERAGVPLRSKSEKASEQTGSSFSERVLRLRRHPTLVGANMDAVIDVARISRDVALSRGQALWRRGEAADFFVFVDSGDISCSNAASDAGVGPLNGLGFAEAVLGVRRPFTARTERDVLVQRVPVDAFLAVLETHFTLAKNVLRELASRTVIQAGSFQ